MLTAAPTFEAQSMNVAVRARLCDRDGDAAVGGIRLVAVCRLRAAGPSNQQRQGFTARSIACRGSFLCEGERRSRWTRR